MHQLKNATSKDKNKLHDQIINNLIKNKHITKKLKEIKQVTKQKKIELSS